MREFPSSVPYGADQTVYLVVEASRAAWQRPEDRAR